MYSAPLTHIKAGEAYYDGNNPSQAISPTGVRYFTACKKLRRFSPHTVNLTPK